MSYPLPDDILEAIIQDLEYPSESRTKDLLSCCVAGTRFVLPCQKALFRSVDIRLVPTTLWRGAVSPLGLPLDDHEAYPQTLAFARAVNTSPHLALYVRKVAFWVPSRWPHEAPPDFTHDGGLDELGWALGKLDLVSDLAVDTTSPRHNATIFREVPYEICMPDELKGVFAAILTSPQTRRFSLHFITGFPGSLLLSAYQLEVLDLRSCEITEDASSLEELRSRKIPAGHLSSLLCDSYTAADDLVQMSANVGPHSGLQFRGIKTFHSDDILLYRVYPKCETLEAIECLHAISATMNHWPSEDVLLNSPLETLNRKSIASLCHLRLHLVHKGDGRPRQESSVANPYLFLCDSLLRQLHNLVTLDLTISFNWSHFVFLCAFGPQWGRLAEVLVVPDAFPRLKRVGVAINIQAQAWMEKDYKARVEEWERKIETLVYAAQLRRLHGLEVGGRPIEFSFTCVTVYDL